MLATILPIYETVGYRTSSNWREKYFANLDKFLDIIENKSDMDKLGDFTKAILQNKSQILGDMAIGLIEQRYADFFTQEYYTCPHCAKSLKNRGKHKKELETLLGRMTYNRPYFYCASCKQGFYPLDELLEVSPQSKQYDLQDVESWLASELPFELASEAFQRCTGETLSAHNVHECTNRIAQHIDLLDVCPTPEEIEAQIAALSDGKFRRPVMMLAIDGAHAPTRPEPSGRDTKRGQGEWREVKGFRLYMIDAKRIVHLISWHQIESDQALSKDLLTLKEAGLIPDGKVRLCTIGDGANWIWNRIREIFPTAKEVLDYYHCSEHLHALAHAHYGKSTKEAREWTEATLTRLFNNQIRHVIAGLKRMIPTSAEDKKEIDKLIRYLSQHKARVNYGAAKRGGYHIGSGAIESSNKCIGHVRLKRSGAWWYPTNANNILKLRCAKFNGVYDRIIEKYKQSEQETFRRSRQEKSDGLIIPF